MLKNGRRIKLEHQLVWFGHYEMAALCEAMGELDEATEHYKRILNGPKSMQVNASGGKVNLQQAVVIRTRPDSLAVEVELAEHSFLALQAPVPHWICCRKRAKEYDEGNDGHLEE